MGELGLNKIFGALLATALGMMALTTLPSLVFAGTSGGHHGDDHAAEQTLTEKMCAQFHHCVEIAEAAAAVDTEAVFDLGAALASADLTRGERLFSGQCSTCHTITPGGANGTGPNLYNVVNRASGTYAGFAYSEAMVAHAVPWSYDELSKFIAAPNGYIRGTKMAYAGIRKESDRVALIAYLRSLAPSPAAIPAPLPAEAPAAPAEAPAAEAPAPT